MKKIAFSLAALTTATWACAQSSATVYGVVDAAVTYTSGKGEGSTSNLQLTPNNNSYSRIGFRGTEDLGGGLSAGYWLEAGIEIDSGSGIASNSNNQASGAGTGTGLAFNRRSLIRLKGGFGELRLGRDIVPTYWNLAMFDTVGDGQGIGNNQILFSALAGGAARTGIRTSNSVGYYLPENLGGFYGQVMYAMGENGSGSMTSGPNPVSNKNDGNYVGARFGYQSGPFNIAVAAGQTQYATGNLRVANVGVSYIFKSLSNIKVTGQYHTESQGEVRGKGALFGLVVPVGAGEIQTSYSIYQRDPQGDGPKPTVAKLAVSYVHNLSKRTAVYGTVAHLSNRNGSAQSFTGSTTLANHGAIGAQVGLRHNF